LFLAVILDLFSRRLIGGSMLMAVSRGNCHHNAVAESFFQLLKCECIKRLIHSTRDDARSDIVDYIKMFYNSKRRRGFNGLLSPVEYENRFPERLVSV
jgi:putative transposase